MDKKLNLSLSLDLDNTWSYLKIHGDSDWEQAPSHFPTFIPTVLSFLKSHALKITFFIVGKDAQEKKNESYLQEIVRAGHSIGNHSFSHEPWMIKKNEKEIENDLKQAHEAIFKATGQTPIGFRGPGFCHSKKIFNVLSQLGYRYDASVLATSLGPIARAYYHLNAKKADKALFGSFANCLLPNTPFQWQWDNKSLLEVPVTTLPYLRTPIHLSYLLWLFQASRALAFGYLKSWIQLCKFNSVSPSLLLHPPDFFDLKEVPELKFFPAMGLGKKEKLAFLMEVFNELDKHFNFISLNDYVKELDRETLKVKKI